MFMIVILFLISTTATHDTRLVTSHCGPTPFSCLQLGYLNCLIYQLVYCRSTPTNNTDISLTLKPKCVQLFLAAVTLVTKQENECSQHSIKKESEK